MVFLKASLFLKAFLCLLMAFLHRFAFSKVNLKTPGKTIISILGQNFIEFIFLP